VREIHENAEKIGKMQSVVVNFSNVRSNRDSGSSSAYGRLNWMTWLTRLSAEPKRPGSNLPGYFKGRVLAQQSSF